MARVLTDLADAGRLALGKILVTAATTPAWTPPFSRADKIATDGGNLVAHISLIAREYGIPAVVAVCDTSRLVRDSKVRRRSYEEDNRHSTREFNVDGNSIHCSVRRVMWILLSR